MVNFRTVAVKATSRSITSAMAFVDEFGSPITDMKSWFQTYGRPEPNAPPGVYSEFTSTAKSVPRGDGMATAQVKGEACCQSNKTHDQNHTVAHEGDAGRRSALAK